MKLHCVVLVSSVLTAVTSMVVVIVVIRSVVIPHVRNRYMRSVCTIRSVTHGPTHGCVHVTVHYMSSRGVFMHGYLLHRHDPENTDKCFCNDCTIVTISDSQNTSLTTMTKIRAADSVHSNDKTMEYSVGQTVKCVQEQPRVTIEKDTQNIHSYDIHNSASLSQSRSSGSTSSSSSSSVHIDDLDETQNGSDTQEPEVTDLAIKTAILFPSLLFVAAFVACFISCIYVCRDVHLQEMNRIHKQKGNGDISTTSTTCIT